MTVYSLLEDDVDCLTAFIPVSPHDRKLFLKIPDNKLRLGSRLSYASIHERGRTWLPGCTRKFLLCLKERHGRFFKYEGGWRWVSG
jgi:hypothetical protein